MKKILISLSIVAAVAAVVVGATTSFFSDTETSTGNTFTAGAIDLGVDNTSYYNGVLNTGTSWGLDFDIDNTEFPGDNPLTLNVVENGYSLPIVRQFFNFSDLKPGDWGEDTISLHVNNNDSWLCADVTLTKNDDVSSTEPELEVAGETQNTDSIFDGELASHLRFTWWADDGDNVLENNEHAIHSNVPLGTGSVALADSLTNIWDDEDNALPGGSTRFIGKAWCFGNGNVGSYPPQFPTGGDDNTDPTVRPVICDGSQESNITQTDSVMADIGFRAVQSRNNPEFVCSVATPNPHVLRLENETEVTGGPWIVHSSDQIFADLTWEGNGPTFNYSLVGQGLAAGTNYSLVYYADGWPGNNPGAFIGNGTSDPSGNISFSGTPNLGVDLPTLPDGNFSVGAKVWLVRTSDYNGGSLSIGPMTAWNPSQYLFEGNVYINYNDTDN